MAEGFLRHFAGDVCDVFSAGMRPSRVHPLAIRVMAEQGIDISCHTSQSVTEFLSESFDYVITVCDNAEENCPLWLEEGTHTHLAFSDPAKVTGSVIKKLKNFREIRDQITKIICDFFGSQFNYFLFLSGCQIGNI